MSAFSSSLHYVLTPPRIGIQDLETFPDRVTSATCFANSIPSKILQYPLRGGYNSKITSTSDEQDFNTPLDITMYERILLYATWFNSVRSEIAGFFRA